MAPEESTARNPLGAVGGYVVENFNLLLAERRLGYKELSDTLAAIGRPIPVLGLSRIAKGKRRVDVDDLVALAVALRVSPSALLLPREGNAHDEVELTPQRSFSLFTLWTWMDGHGPLPSRQDGKVSWLELADFAAHARPTKDISGVDPDEVLRMKDRYGYVGEHEGDADDS